MEEPMTLKYQPSTPHSTTFSSFFSDDSLLLVTPEKPIPSISYKNIFNEKILDNLKSNEVNDEILNFPLNNSSYFCEPENNKHLLNEKAYINNQIKSDEYIFKNLERSKHQDILRRENQLDLEAKSNLGKFNIPCFNHINKDKHNIEKKTDINPNIQIDDGAAQMCRESKVNFYQAVSVHCFSPEDSNLSQFSDSTSNESPTLVEVSDNQTIKSTLSPLPSSSNLNKSSKFMLSDSNMSVRNKNKPDFLLHEPYIDNLTNSFDINKYTSCFPNGFYGSYRDNLNEYSICDDSGSSTNMPYKTTIDSFNNNSSLNDSPLVIPAIDLSFLSLTSNESTDIDNKAKNLGDDVNIKSHLNSNLRTNGTNLYLAPTKDVSKSNNENNWSKEVCNFDKKKCEFIINENSIKQPVENVYNKISQIIKSNYTENYPIETLNKSCNSENNITNLNCNIVDNVKLNSNSNILSENIPTKKLTSKPRSKKALNTKCFISDTSTSNKKDILENCKVNILSEARLNSLLTLTKKVETLKKNKFIENVHIDANLKAKIEEKALNKLNHPSSVSTFNDLPSLEVNESELIFKKNNIAFTNRQPGYLEKLKNESNFKMPELLDFYSNSLYSQPSKSFANVQPNFLPIPKCQSSLANLQQGNEIYEKFVKYSNYKHGY